MTARTYQKPGFVEIESSYARLVRHETQGWACKTIPLVGDSPWPLLKTEMQSFFPGGSQLVFVFQERCGIRMFHFPSTLSPTEILGNLRLRRDEYFGSREEYLLSLRMGNPVDGKNREVYVTFVPRSLSDSAQELCASLGYSLQRIVTGFDALLGATARQLGRNNPETVVIASLGYSQVNLAAWRGGELIMVRSLLTGSIKELENAVFSAFSITPPDLMRILSESLEVPPAVKNSIADNRQEIMTHIGTLFAELRGRKLLSENPTLFLCQPVVAEPQLASMLSERFSARVIELNGIMQDETAVGEDFPRWSWLLGGVMPAAINVLPPRTRMERHLAASPRLAFFAMIVMCIAPFILMRSLKSNIALENALLIEQNQAFNQIVELNRSNQELYAGVETIASGVTADISRRGQTTTLIRYLSESLPALTRLEKLEILNKEGKVTISGKSVDTESSLRYLDAVKASPFLEKVEISFDSPGGTTVSFSITGLLTKKG